MIKGNSMGEKPQITRKDINYRQLSSLNCSMIKLFDSDPVKFFEQFKLGRRPKDNGKTISFSIGDLVDFYLLDCRANEDEFNNRFEEKFALYEENKGKGQVFQLADILFDITQKYTDIEGVVTTSFESRFTEAFNKIKEIGRYSGKTEEQALEDFENNAYDYFNYKINNAGKTVIDVSLLDKSKRVAISLLNDPFTKEVFVENDSEEYFPKFPIEWIYTTKSGKKISCKSEIDILKIDHVKKCIYLKDLKTIYDNEVFEYQYLKFRYDLQAAFYYLAVRYWADEEGMSSYSIERMEFIVGDTSSNNRRPVRYQTTEEDLQASLNGFKLGYTTYKGVHQIMEEIDWAEENNIWNVSKDIFLNSGRTKLNLRYENQ